MSDRIVATFNGTVESVSPDARRSNEDRARFRPVKSDGTLSQYFDVLSCRTGVLKEGNWRVTVLIKSIPFADKKSGKPASFLSLWVLEADPLA